MRSGENYLKQRGWRRGYGLAGGCFAAVMLGSSVSYQNNALLTTTEERKTGKGRSSLEYGTVVPSVYSMWCWCFWRLFRPFPVCTQEGYYVSLLPCRKQSVSFAFFNLLRSTGVTL